MTNKLRMPSTSEMYASGQMEGHWDTKQNELFPNLGKEYCDLLIDQGILPQGEELDG